MLDGSGESLENPVNALFRPVGGNLLISFTQPAGVTGINYGAEWSATMLPADWHPVADSGVLSQHTFSVPVGTNPQLFMRLKVTAL